jgi:hypothetical protein
MIAGGAATMLALRRYRQTRASEPATRGMTLSAPQCFSCLPNGHQCFSCLPK